LSALPIKPETSELILLPNRIPHAGPCCVIRIFIFERGGRGEHLNPDVVGAEESS